MSRITLHGCSCVSFRSKRTGHSALWQFKDVSFSFLSIHLVLSFRNRAPHVHANIFIARRGSSSVRTPVLRIQLSKCTLRGGSFFVPLRNRVGPDVSTCFFFFVPSFVHFTCALKFQMAVKTKGLLVCERNEEQKISDFQPAFLSPTLNERPTSRITAALSRNTLTQLLRFYLPILDGQPGGRGSAQLRCTHDTLTCPLR